MKAKSTKLCAEVIDMGATIWEDVKHLADEGVSCPCCNQLVQRYRRRLHAEMARFLYRLYQADRDEPGLSFHVRLLNPATAEASTDAAYLVHWGLVTKDGCGSYAITEKGREFCQGTIYVPERIDLLCGQFERLSGKMICILDVLGRPVSVEDISRKTKGHYD